MKLYHCPQSRSLRVIWLAEEIGLDIEVKRVGFPPRRREPAYLEVNPTGLVPAIEMDGVRLLESMAICEVLAERHAPQLRLAPADADWPSYVEFLHLGESTLVPPLTQIVRYRMIEPKERRLPQAVEDGATAFIDRLKIVESRLDGREFLAGDRLTLADISVGYALHLGDFLRLSDQMPPRTGAYLARLRSRPAFQRAMERN